MPGLSTRAVHAGDEADPRTGAVNTPVHLSSTFWYPELPGGGKSDYIYSRYTNPTLEAVERKVASLEGASRTLLFSSGMGAIAAACTSILRPGDTLAHQAGIYGGTAAFFRDHLGKWGVRPHALAPAGAAKVPKGTRLVWMESITNPLLRVADVEAWADAAHDAGALHGVDATYASPALQRPLSLGADVVMQSATKYLGGHADLIAGVLSWSKGFAPAEDVWRARRDWGATLDPHAAFLLGRGAKTLAVRIERQCANAAALAKAASAMKGVKAVHYPGLASHPDHATAKRLLPDGFGCAVTIDLGTLAAAQRFRRRVKVIAPAASLGGVESLVSLPVETSHAYATAAQRKAEGIGDGLLRISVGIEDAEDIVADVRQAAGGA
jgi:cystathionine beta-lyase/cystathionine gamma-synthase